RQRESWDRSWRRAAAVAGVTRHSIQLKPFGCLVDIHDQLNHFTCSSLLRLGVRGVVPLTLIVDVTIIATPSQRSGKEIHYRNQLRFWHTGKDLNVFSDLFDGFLLRRLRFGCAHHLAASVDDEK